MDRPPGFADWSEECKRRFAELAREWGARQDAQAASEAADAAASEAASALDELRAAQDADERQLAEDEAWLAAYNARRAGLRKRIRDLGKQLQAAEKARKSRQAELEKELTDAFTRWRGDNPSATRDQVRAKRKELLARGKAELDELDAELDTIRGEIEAHQAEYKGMPAEKKTRRARSKALRKAIGARAKQLDAADAAARKAREAADKARKALAGARSEDAMIADYFALIRRCGPRDPAAGGESVPVPLDEPGPAEPTPWQRRLEEYRRDQPAYSAVDAPAAEPAFVQIGDDEQLPDDWVDGEDWIGDEDWAFVPIRFGKVWHEGCVELLWVQGTRPTADPRYVSNPITRTVARAMREANALWAPCCVRFRVYLKVVTMAQLGALGNATDGISMDGEDTTSASKDAISAEYGRIIRGLQDHPECTGLLVVDQVRGGAGFARLGAGVGVVTIRWAPGQRRGTTIAHELGHAVGAIRHVETTADGTVRHAHGDLMWGEGCAGYPNRERNRRYERVTDDDCAKMYAATPATTDPCEEGGDGAL